MKRIHKVILSGLLTLSIGGLGVGAATAASGLCDSGYACVYQHTSYKGSMYGTAKQQYDLKNVNFANKASSASVNGASCRYTEFYNTWHWWDSKPIGYAFTLNSRQIVGHTYRDADLRNGAGESSENWNDKIDALLFTGC